MYSEMLAGGMVPEENRKDYANTLVAEADRLTYLVDNVLQYARLERGVAGSAVEQLTIGELLSRFSSRLGTRAESVGLKLVVDAVEDVRQRSIKTVPANIEQILFNLVDNACKYARPSSRKQIDLVASVVDDRVIFSVQDYGPGVDSLEHQSLFKPFHKSATDQADTSSGVGLGLALCKRMAESLSGTIACVRSDEGARFEFEFPCN
jgi:K+-sensing histidine kinase KdpD